jgi:hypothetical protein
LLELALRLYAVSRKQGAGNPAPKSIAVLILYPKWRKIAIVSFSFFDNSRQRQPKVYIALGACFEKSFAFVCLARVPDESQGSSAPLASPRRELSRRSCCV